jgi:hypothetical protein
MVQLGIEDVQYPALCLFFEAGCARCVTELGGSTGARAAAPAADLLGVGGEQTHLNGDVIEARVLL